MTESEYFCIHCNGTSKIKVLKETEKATEPTIEFCPFCGMSSEYPVEENE